MKKTVNMLMIFAAFMIYSTVLYAQESQTSQLFSTLDKNSDQVVDVAEAEDNTFVMQEFSRIDKNNNNKLDKNEFKAYEPLQRYRPPIQEKPEIGAAPTK